MGTAPPEAVDSGDDGDGPLDLDNEQLTEEESSVEFFDLLVELKLKNTLSAKQVCTIAYWATKAGMTGKNTTLALSPSTMEATTARRSTEPWGYTKSGALGCTTWKCLGTAARRLAGPWCLLTCWRLTTS